MVRLLILVLILVTVSFGEVYYCLQLASSEHLNDLKSVFPLVENYPDARIELIKGKYTIRVGFFNTKERAGTLLKEIRRFKEFRDSFLRTCLYKPERIVLYGKGGDMNDLMKLLLSALIGSGKQEEAIKLAKKGTQLFPQDPFWWDRYATLLIWNNRSKEALEPTLKAYNLTGDKKYAERAFSLALSLERYDIAEKLIDEVKPSYKLALEVYKGLGEVEKIIKLLRAQEDKEAKHLLAEILFYTGQKKEALEVIEEIENRYGVDTALVLLKANILYSEKRHWEAYKTLKAHAQKEPKEGEFWETFSDLAWMLEEYEDALKASLNLISTGEGRAEDYERASLVLSRRDPERALRLSLEGWKKFKIPSLLETALNIAYKSEMWDTILSLAEGDSERELMLSKDYLLIYYVSALLKTGRRDTAFEIMEDRLEKGFSPDLLTFYLYTLLDMDNPEKLKTAIRKFERYSTLLPEPFIFAYIKLQYGKKAMDLYRRAGMDDKLVLAEILTAVGKEDEARKIRHKEFLKRTEVLKKSPVVAEDSDFMRDYLYLASEFLKSPAYERLLFASQRTLPSDVWREVYLSYLLSKGRYDKERRLVRFRGYKEKAWMKLNRMLHYEERYGIKNLLSEKKDILPRRDKVEAYRRLFAYEGALNTAFASLEHSPYDYRLYKQLRDLTMEHGNNMGVSAGFLSRKGYSETRETFHLILRDLQLGWGAELGADVMFPLSKDSDVVKYAPEGFKVSAKFTKRFERSRFDLQLGVFKRLKANPFVIGSYETNWLKRTSVTFTTGINTETYETIYLYLGGVKDFLRLSAFHNITNRVGLSLELEGSKFLSSDRTELGKGASFTLYLERWLRLNYPDIRIQGYGQLANYSSSGKLGDTVSVLPDPSYQVLPEDYLAAGVGVYIGYINKETYTRVWRPFLGVDLGVNSRYGILAGLEGGLGGSLIDRDHFTIGFNVNQNAGGVKETLTNLRLDYRRWF
ncbi:tetratricopeptide repeat protein [Hydrogenivirga caldilitoris]|uniref:Tetratricopeptide repeat protein n=1 Tax=Hydrogenivirga caldilitoris TaxID=246264 RepID=A0A497XMH9_9AQUI|nr:tetratricopeptide repeat protein [Hydrogenivirga caldilitoris]RLJ70107.1 tetratricopeptide repeat protein [Hydrogenivirga caldilitoris]